MADVDAPQQDNEILNAKMRRFQEFLDSDQAGAIHEEKLRSMMSRGDSRLLVDVGDLRAYDSKLCGQVLNSPAEYLPAFDKAVAEAVAHLNPEYGKESKAQFSVGFEGDFGSHHVTPRNLTSTMVNKLVSISGIVTKCSLVRPKILKSVHYCDATKQIHQREYRDATSFSGLPTGSTYMTRDDDGNVLTTEYGLCEYTDSQALHLQEMPEHAEVGQLPRSVDILVSNDLVDKVKPGDRVQVIGVYKPLAGRAESSAGTGLFRTVVIGVALRSLAKHMLQSAMTEKDISNIRKLAQQRDYFGQIASSLAPSICGHDYVKKGLLLLLLGGMEKNLANGTHIRGDINMLLVGDPSVAKSQLLRYVLNVAPLAVSTTGRGSSGVGLTAAVTADSETGERKLEAGAMVLADRGIVCIDEFDKMSDQDRVAIHEVMEQQTVTIAKAGIHTSLNARCSVVAAANPVYGSYNRQKKTTENVGLPDSLLSRFDLLFILLDTVEEAHDKRISDHVLRVHRYRGKEGEQSLVNEEDEEDETPENEEEETPMYEKYNRSLHGDRKAGQEGVLTQAFLKKYIRFARRMKPKLDGPASDRIAHIYMDLRGTSDGAGAAPVTPRTLETLIRLATAHAKLRLSGLVEEKDVEVAYEVMLFALTNETPPERREGAEDEEGAEGGESDGDDDDDDDEDGNWKPGSGGKKGGKKRGRDGAKRKTRQTGEEGGVEEEDEEEGGGGGGTGAAGGKRQRRAEGGEGSAQASPEGKGKEPKGKGKKEGAKPTVSDERYQAFSKHLNDYFVIELQTELTGTESAAVKEVLAYINGKSRPKYTRAEADVILELMTDNNNLYVSDDCVFRL